MEDIIRDEDILWKYHDAGIMHIYLGLETSTDELLTSLNKGTTIDQNQQAIDLVERTRPARRSPSSVRRPAGHSRTWT